MKLDMKRDALRPGLEIRRYAEHERGRRMRIHRRRRLTGLLIGLAALTLAGGCVERTLKISSEPPGARVFLNDKEVGVTPAKVNFLWYGDYDVILRKEGYETLKANYVVKAPWYQLPPIDLIAECFVASTIKDEHELPLYELSPAKPPAIKDVVDRAVEIRDQAVITQP
jgi:hypothetical protein